MNPLIEKYNESLQQLTGAGAPWEISTNTIDGIEYKFYPQAPKTLVELLDAGRAHGDKEFLNYEGERLSFAQYFAKADALALQLQNKFDIKAGDRVAIAMRNYPEWMIAFTAIANTGAIIVPLNSWGQTAELEYGIKDSGAKLLICDQRRFEYISEQLAGLNCQAIVARHELSLPAEQDFDALVSETLGQSANAVEIKPEDNALIMYTSGTTGNPKGALSNHTNICQAIYNFETCGIAAAMSNPEVIGKMLEKGFEAKVLLAVPLFHVSGCYSVFLLSLRGGRSISMMYKWDVEAALKLIQDERITMLSAVPTIVWQLLDSEHFEKYDTISLFSIGAGGAAQPARLPGLIEDKVDNVFPGTGYGMTETNATGFAATGNIYQAQPTSCGLATPIVEIKIIDADGKPVAQGETGEICLRTPTMIQGYWGKEDATAESFQDGWFISGDVGHLNEDGYLFITDRLKDMVIRGGENIYPAEIEASAYQLEGIEEVAVYGVPHEVLGEELKATVVLKAATDLTAEAISEHLKANLAGFKVPAEIQISSEPLPRNAAGKLLKKQLQQQ